MMVATANRDGRAAWQILLRECKEPSNDLSLLEHDYEWSHASILGIVGYNSESITNFSRHLNHLKKK